MHYGTAFSVKDSNIAALEFRHCSVVAGSINVYLRSRQGCKLVTFRRNLRFSP